MQKTIAIIIATMLFFSCGLILFGKSTNATSREFDVKNNNIVTSGENLMATDAYLNVHIQEIQADDDMDGFARGEAEWYFWVGLMEGDSVTYKESAVPVVRGNDNPTIDETYTFSLTDTDRTSYNIIITLLEEDSTSDDLADICEGDLGGKDDIGQPDPPSSSYYGGSYVGSYDITSNALGIMKTEPYNGERITKGSWDGNTGDENDANVVFSVSDNYEPPTASFSTDSTDISSGESVSFDASDSSASKGSGINSYQWDFDEDGTYDSSGISTSNTYETPGLYDAELKVTDNWGISDTDTVLITVRNRPPEADFSYSPSNPTTADDIQFTDESTDPDGSYSIWEWDFDDGEFSNENPAIHRYEDNGSYEVTLTIIDDQATFDSISKTINVVNQKPIANFSYTPSNPKTLENISLEDTSFDKDGNIVSREWSFGNGESSTINETTTSYEDDGEYNVTLIVTDDDGDSYTISKTIQIDNREPDANFSLTPNKPTTDDNIEFNDNSKDLDGSIDSYEWHFGDGESSTKENPIHEYYESGDYTVELIITDDDGETHSIEKTISVEKEEDGGGAPGFSVSLMIVSLMIVFGVLAIAIYTKKVKNE